MARLAKIRKEREEAAAKRDALKKEAEGKLNSTALLHIVDNDYS